MTYVIPDQFLFLGHETSLEHIISQLQPNTDKILCVQDGYKLLVLNSGKDLPTNLKLQLKKYNIEAKTYEYHYRCRDNDSAYVIFHPFLHEWIETGRVGNYHIQLSKPTIIERSAPAVSLPIFDTIPLLDEEMIDSDDDLRGKEFSFPSTSQAKVEENLYFSQSLSKNT